jgi:hypothetical protein
MQVLLRRSEFRQDIRCSVCDQGFRLYWEQNSPSERATMRSIVLGELRDHHSREQAGTSTAAHIRPISFGCRAGRGLRVLAENSFAGPSRPPATYQSRHDLPTPKRQSQAELVDCRCFLLGKDQKARSPMHVCPQNSLKVGCPFAGSAFSSMPETAFLPSIL